VAEAGSEWRRPAERRKIDVLAILLGRASERNSASTQGIPNAQDFSTPELTTDNGQLTKIKPN
jgi:hypothetical protein